MSWWLEDLRFRCPTHGVVAGKDCSQDYDVSLDSEGGENISTIGPVTCDECGAEVEELDDEEEGNA